VFIFTVALGTMAEQEVQAWGFGELITVTHDPTGVRTGQRFYLISSIDSDFFLAVCTDGQNQAVRLSTNLEFERYCGWEPFPDIFFGFVPTKVQQLVYQAVTSLSSQARSSSFVSYVRGTELFVFVCVCVGGSELFRYARDSFETVGRGSMVLNFDWRHQTHDKPVSDFVYTFLSIPRVSFGCLSSRCRSPVCR
jgi:hypothetical protein